MAIHDLKGQIGRLPQQPGVYLFLGAAGETFGLGFFDSPREFETAQTETDPEAFLGRRGKWSLLYGSIDEMPLSTVTMRPGRRATASRTIPGVSP